MFILQSRSWKIRCKIAGFIIIVFITNIRFLQFLYDETLLLFRSKSEWDFVNTCKYTD